MSQRFALIFLVLLRIAIGWHFSFEALEKIDSNIKWGRTDTRKPWTSETYFREGTGPLGAAVRSKIGDLDDMALARLTIRSAPTGIESAKASPRQRLPEALAKELAKQGRRPTLFVEVNTGAEPQKAGVLPEDTDEFLKACRERYGLDIAGLMCIPPADEPPAPHFALTAKIARRNGLSLLSMGMSADFPLAIAFGATHVRVGTAIFGART